MLLIAFFYSYLSRRLRNFVGYFATMSGNKTNNVAGNNTESSEDIGDAFGNGRNSVSPSVGSSQNAPIELDSHYYKINHPKRGVAVIFNHEIFDDLKPRIGTNVDCENLVNTLRNLGFEVHVHQNAVQKDVVKELERVTMNHGSKS